MNLSPVNFGKVYVASDVIGRGSRKVDEKIEEMKIFSEAQDDLSPKTPDYAISKFRSVDVKSYKQGKSFLEIGNDILYKMDVVSKSGKLEKSVFFSVEDFKNKSAFEILG